MAKLTQKAKSLIDGKNFGFLATIMKDGSPQVTPVWVDREGDYILVNTTVGRVKQKNIERDPRVAIAIADSNNPYSKVTIRGKVAEQIFDGADKHIDKLAKKYLGQDRYPWRGKEKRVIIKIKPEKISE